MWQERVKWMEKGRENKLMERTYSIKGKKREGRAGWYR